MVDMYLCFGSTTAIVVIAIHIDLWGMRMEKQRNTPKFSQSNGTGWVGGERKRKREKMMSVFVSAPKFPSQISFTFCVRTGTRNVFVSPSNYGKLSAAAIVVLLCKGPTYRHTHTPAERKKDTNNSMSYRERRSTRIVSIGEIAKSNTYNLFI